MDGRMDKRMDKAEFIGSSGKVAVLKNSHSSLNTCDIAHLWFWNNLLKYIHLQKIHFHTSIRFYDIRIFEFKESCNLINQKRFWV